jgi:hypothetical protein
VAHENPALYIIQMSVAVEDDDEFNRWNEEEHVAERLSCPGFLSARRYRLAPAALRGGEPTGPDRRYHLTVYEIAAAEVLTSEAYLEMTAKPTPWTQRMVDRIDVTFRGVFVPADAKTSAHGSPT